MTSNDLESYKAAIERLGLETNEWRWLAVTLECGISPEDAMELIP